MRKWLKRQARTAFAVFIISIIFGLVTIFVAERICYVRGLSLDKIERTEKKKLLANYKKQNGDNWQEDAIKQYKEKYGDEWKEHAKADYQALQK
jgi:hypothetical protein